MNSILEKIIIGWPVKVIEMNPILGAVLLGFITIAVVFYVPVQLYNILRVPLTISMTIAFLLNAAHLFAVFRKVHFNKK